MNSVSALSINYADLGIGVAVSGEAVVLIQSHFFRISSEGVPIDMEGGREVTDAMIVTFDAENLRNDFAVSDIEELVDHCEKLRAGKNVLYALRVDGKFRSLTLRSSPSPSISEDVAGRKQCVDPRIVENVDGTLIGIWSSRFTSSICAPGYYFFFVSHERDCGGFVINCSGPGLRMLGMPITNLRIIHLDCPRSEAGKES